MTSEGDLLDAASFIVPFRGEDYGPYSRRFSGNREQYT